MAILLYNLAIYCFTLALKLASPFHSKAKKMIEGRKHWNHKLKMDLGESDRPLVWFHCASLGEFEQGRPLIESFRLAFPRYRILLTFFSPSGYEVRNDYSGADAIHYLPLDSAKNARMFYDIANPLAAFIIKYEFWYHLINEGHHRGIPVMVSSAIFRKNQIFFKPFGGLFRTMLENLDHIFVQDAESLELLAGIDINAVTISGDTRIDRVAAINEEAAPNEIVEQFLDGQNAFIVGSSWPQDISVLAPLINKENQLKFIIAPHEITAGHLNQIENLVNRPIIHYSKFRKNNAATVLVIDCIGILSQLYRYGKYAYVGGGFGQGLHNILEAATFGLPLFFGNRSYTNFGEAEALVKMGGAFAISDSTQLQLAFNNLSQNEGNYRIASQVCRKYVKKNTGATEVIMHHVSRMFNN